MARRDEYEADVMGGDEALYREKHVSRVFAGLMALPALAAVAGAIAVAFDPAASAAAALGPLAAAGIVTAAGLYFAVMRTTVTHDAVRVQYGTLGPTIAVSAIEAIEVVRLDALTRFAFGPKLWPEGWRYIPPGVKEGVRITWRGGRRSKQCTIGADDAGALAAAIARARARARAAPKVRVEHDEDLAHDVGVAHDEEASIEADRPEGARRRG